MWIFIASVNQVVNLYSGFSFMFSIKPFHEATREEKYRNTEFLVKGSGFMFYFCPFFYACDIGTLPYYINFLGLSFTICKVRFKGHYLEHVLLWGLILRSFCVNYNAVNKGLPFLQLSIK